MKKQRGPKYSIGTKVKHVSAKKWGVIKDSFWDGRCWRYEVRHSGWLWSIPEWALTK